MNVELNEAGMTFLVGAFALLGAEAISYFIFGRHVIRFFEGRLGISDTGTPAALTTGAFIGLSFALGLLVEDVSFKYADPLVYRPFQFTYSKLHLAASDHDDGTVKNAMQYSVLISKLRVQNPELTGLGEAVFSSGLFESLFGTDGGAVSNWALHGGPLPLRGDDRPFKTLERTITSAFYFAKNRVYNNERYFTEMSRIQGRLEFSATIAAVSLAFACVSLLLALTWLPVVWRTPQLRSHLARRGGLLGISFLTLYLLAYLAYVQESVEYNKRVFGYYDSMLRAARACGGAVSCAGSLP